MACGKSKIVTCLSGAGLLGVLVLVCGCSASHPTAMWSARPVFNDARVGTSGSGSSVVFSPGLSGEGLAMGASAPGHGRNDGLMAVRDVSLRGELLGLPSERLPSLHHRRVYRGANRANEYVYPGESWSHDRGYRGYHGYRGYRGYRGYGGYRDGYRGYWGP